MAGVVATTCTIGLQAGQREVRPISSSVCRTWTEERVCWRAL